MDIQSSIHNCGDKNPAGIQTRLYLVCACDIDVWPDRLATTGLGDSITLDGDITLKATKVWAEFDIITKTGEVKNTAIGPDGSKSFEQTLDFKKANIGVGVEEWFNDNINMCAIAVFVDKLGVKRVMGAPGSPVKFESTEGTLGMGPDTGREWTGQLKAHTGEVTLVYTGLLPIV